MAIKLVMARFPTSITICECEAKRPSKFILIQRVGADTQKFSDILEQRVQEINLPNGLNFLILQRSNAPIVSCHTHANIGAFDEIAGQTGVKFASVSSSIAVSGRYTAHWLFLYF